MKKITKLIMRYSPLLLIQVLMSVGVSICVTRGNSIISTLVDDMLQGQAVIYYVVCYLYCLEYSLLTKV